MMRKVANFLIVPLLLVLVVFLFAFVGVGEEYRSVMITAGVFVIVLFGVIGISYFARRK